MDQSTGELLLLKATVLVSRIEALDHHWEGKLKNSIEGIILSIDEPDQAFY